MKSKQTTSEKIKWLRNSRGLSRSELSDLLRIPYSTLASYENGSRKPPLEFFTKISAEFGIPIEYLISQNLTDGNTYELKGNPYEVYEARLRNSLTGIAWLIEETDGKLFNQPMPSIPNENGEITGAGEIHIQYKSFFNFLRACFEIYHKLLSGAIDDVAYHACVDALCITYADQFTEEINYFDEKSYRSHQPPEQEE